MYNGMTTTKGERVHIRIDDDMKHKAIVVAKLRGHSSLTNLITTLLQEQINQERKERPDLFDDELKLIRAESGVKRSVPVVSPANVADGNHVKRTPKEHKTLTKRGRKR